MLNDRWTRVVISEGLEEPSLIGDFEVFKARISKKESDLPTDRNAVRARELASPNAFLITEDFSSFI